MYKVVQPCFCKKYFYFKSSGCGYLYFVNKSDNFSIWDYSLNCVCISLFVKCGFAYSHSIGKMVKYSKEAISLFPAAINHLVGTLFLREICRPLCTQLRARCKHRAQRCQPSLFQREASYFCKHFCPFWLPNLATSLFLASFVPLKLHVILKTSLFLGLNPPYFMDVNVGISASNSLVGPPLGQEEKKKALSQKP